MTCRNRPARRSSARRIVFQGIQPEYFGSSVSDPSTWVDLRSERQLRHAAFSNFTR